MKYKLGETIWEMTQDSFCHCKEVGISVYKGNLLKMGATPIDDKPEDGEREGACIFCGMRREDRLPCIGHIEHHFSREKRATSTKQDKPEPPHEHKWLHNKWRTEYLTQCALDMLCDPHEFEPKLDTRFKYHVCQKCGLVVFKGDKPEKIEMPIDDEPSWKDLRDWMKSVTSWINNHEREE